MDNQFITGFEKTANVAVKAFKATSSKAQQFGKKFVSDTVRKPEVSAHIAKMRKAGIPEDKILGAMSNSAARKAKAADKVFRSAQNLKNKGYGQDQVKSFVSSKYVKN